jgi:hypothetical protein
VAVDFSAEPNPEGLALAAQLRAERRQRDKALEDRAADVSARRESETAGPVGQVRVAGGADMTQAEGEESVVDERYSQPERQIQVSPRAALEAMAAASRSRKNDRQR